MNHLKITLPAPLTGIARAPHAEPLPPPVRTPDWLDAQPSAPFGGASEQALQTLARELSKLVLATQTRARQAQSEAARVGVELGMAVAERLLGEAFAADRQRLDRAILGALERMLPARQVVVRGHADDMALLGRQMAAHADLERYRNLLVLQTDESCARGQWRLEADDWFMEWDASRSLAELRALLLEETYLDD